MADLLARLRAALTGHYTIERELGRGGMATVYLGRDLKHHRAVAIKVLRPELAEALGPERFVREIEIAAGLTHPHILPLHDSGDADGFLYYVMPYVEGESLRDRLNREKQLSIDDATRIAREVATALAYAHSHDVVHRDIKPENILLVAGQAVVSDFGIARGISAAGGEKLTATGVSVGTPVYMSPEQAAGRGQLDGRSDIYSLGCVLYEMLAGQAPFTGPTAESVLHQHLTAEPPRISAIRGAVPASLEAVIRRVLAKVPADRFANAAQLAEALAEPVPGLPPVRRGRRVATIAAAVGAVIVIAGVASGLWLTRSRGAAVQSLAVLPLANLSMDSSQGYFADAMTDLMITHLARSPYLRVTSRTSTLRYRGGQKSLPEIARELHVDLVVEGSVVREGPRVRITAQLIRAPTDEHVWANSFERDFSHVLALQQDVAGAIAEQIGIKLAPWHSAATPSANPQAQEEYLRGIYYYGMGDMMKSAQALEQAVTLDPDHALAYAALARTYYFIAFFGDLPPKEAFERMEAAATKALDKDPTLASAHGSLALVKLHRDWDWASAEQHFRRALELSPSNADIHHDYAHLLLVLRRDRESVTETERAVALDPFNPMLNACLGWHRLFAGEYDQAIEASNRSLQIQPANFWARMNLGWAYEQKAMYPEALTQFKAASELKPMSMGMGSQMEQTGMANPMAMQMSAEAARITATRADLVVLAAASLGHALGAAGDRPGARVVLDRLLRQREHGYVSPYDVALVYAGLGDKDKALDWLQRAYQERSSLLVFALREPRLAPLRSEPRFVALMREYALPQ
ncbi:MAG TPA: protein kinase [Gemmatimonadales bacterium]|nr:protein kinase [Gemmatimonadales bacterium]